MVSVRSFCALVLLILTIVVRAEHLHYIYTDPEHQECFMLIRIQLIKIWFLKISIPVPTYIGKIRCTGTVAKIR